MQEKLLNFFHDPHGLLSEAFGEGFVCGTVELAAVLAAVTLAYLGCSLFCRSLNRRLLARYAANPICTIIVASGVFPRGFLMIPLIVLGFMTAWMLPDGHLAKPFLAKLVQIGFYVICAYVFAGALDALYALTNYCRRVTASPLKGIFQILKLFGYGLALIAVLAALIGRDPTYIVSCLTALSAVLMLIFRDSILGLTAGVTLSGNRMIGIGDWIEVPTADADGEVIDVTLTSVRVQNWDKTITTIPAYDLISKPFKNWRGMSEAGARRIKRAIVLDMDSVGFATDAQIQAWMGIDLLRDYFDERLREVRAYNNAHPSAQRSVINARKLTNIGTFRVYCDAYLRAHPQIRQDLTVIVRQLQSTERGIPMEIYCFTTVTEWGTYENIQSDIFDRLLAILPEFGLRTFQLSSAASMRTFSEAVAKTAKN